MKCRKCKTKFSEENAIYQGVYYFCSTECRYEFMIAQKGIKPSEKPINSISKTNKNVIAKFTSKTKAEMLARDKVCIISGEKGTQRHHCYFGANSNRGENRNNLDQGVLLSESIHHEIHHGTSGKGKIYRAKCINYLLILKK